MSRKHVSDLQVVRAATAFWADYGAGVVKPRNTAERLSAQTNEPEKVCWRAVERAIAHGYLAYGVSLRTSYPTEKGKALLLESGLT